MTYFLLAVALASAQTETWSYEGGLKCFKAFSSFSTPTPLIALNKDSIGVTRGGHDEADGFFILTEKSVFFVAAAEGEKSAGTDESKITAVLGDGAASPLKFFFKTAAHADSPVTFAVANEFDRQTQGRSVPPDTVKGILIRAIKKSFEASEPQVKTKPAALAKAIATCEEARIDFPITGPKLESTLRAEMKKLKAKMQPGVFSKEYWLPKKEGAG